MADAADQKQMTPLTLRSGWARQPGTFLSLTSTKPSAIRSVAACCFAKPRVACLKRAGGHAALCKRALLACLPSFFLCLLVSLDAGLPLSQASGLQARLLWFSRSIAAPQGIDLGLGVMSRLALRRSSAKNIVARSVGIVSLRRVC